MYNPYNVYIYNVQCKIIYIICIIYNIIPFFLMPSRGGQFRFARILAMGTSNFLMFFAWFAQHISVLIHWKTGSHFGALDRSVMISGHFQKVSIVLSSPVAPAAKTIYGSCAGDWHVTSLKGNATSIKQECSMAPPISTKPAR